MPEELNRVLADHASSLLLCSSELAASNLRQEGVRGTVVVVGDVMVDVASAVQPRARARLDLLAPYGLKPGRYVVATAHRAGNVDDPDRLRRLVDLLAPFRCRWYSRSTRARGAGSSRRADAAARGRRCGDLTPPLGYVS